jgi:hypothetical protein
VHTPDFDRFRKLMTETARALPPKDPLDDAMIQAYWNALKDLPIEIVEACQKSWMRYGKWFPKPSELRPKGEAHKQQLPSEGPQRNNVRDYWRDVIVGEMCWWLGMSMVAFEPILVAAKDTLGGPLRALLDELEQQDRRDGRTVGQHKYAQRITGDLARQFKHLRTEHAPQLPEQRQSELEAFA